MKFLFLINAICGKKTTTSNIEQERTLRAYRPATIFKQALKLLYHVKFHFKLILN